MEKIKYESLQSLIAETLNKDVNDVQLDSHLQNDLGADSLELVELVMACEDKYNIEISDDDANKFYTPKLMLEYINNYK